MLELNKLKRHLTCNKVLKVFTIYNEALTIASYDRKTDTLIVNTCFGKQKQMTLKELFNNTKSYTITEFIS